MMMHALRTVWQNWMQRKESFIATILLVFFANTFFLVSLHVFNAARLNLLDQTASFKALLFLEAQTQSDAQLLKGQVEKLLGQVTLLSPDEVVAWVFKDEDPNISAVPEVIPWMIVVPWDAPAVLSDTNIKLLRTMIGIKEIVLPSQMVRHLSHMRMGLLLGFGLLSFVAAALVLITIVSQIRQSVSLSRREIDVLRLVGATESFIQLPFFLQGLLCTFLSSLLSLGFFAWLHWKLTQSLPLDSGLGVLLGRPLDPLDAICTVWAMTTLGGVAAILGAKRNEDDPLLDV